jgi:hypothetical protein
MTDATQTIAEFPKNRTETVVVALTEFNGLDLIDVRIHGAYDGGEHRATRKGVSLRVGLLDDLIAALSRARDEAERRGLI